jgi:hypothetical protein
MAARKRTAKTNGVGQLSLVEHALCPLDSRKSLRVGQVFKTGYFYTNEKRQRKRSNVEVICPLGLSAVDEFNLWGMLALTLANKETDGNLFATRYYILSQLGVIDCGSRRGGRQYSDLTASLERLSAVTYRSDAFYDPIRAEHRKASFGLLSFSAPQDEKSDRAWRVAWDPVFFEFIKPIGGSLRFNFELYSQLDPASRRLFLFLAKMFKRRTTSGRLELKHLAIDMLGYSPTVSNRDVRIKVQRSIKRLEENGVLAKHSDHEFIKRDGQYTIMLHRGRDYSRVSDSPLNIESPLIEPLQRIGLDNRAIQRTLSKFSVRLLNQWTDITLAAIERYGKGKPFFNKCPAAFLVDNLNHAAKGTRLPPDWWHEIRRAEERSQAKLVRDKRVGDKPDRNALPEKAIESFDNLNETIFGHFLASGQNEKVAKVNSNQFQAAIRKRKSP